MELDTKIGDKVKLTNIHYGRKYDQEKVKEHLIENNLYTVLNIDIDDWLSQVSFKEIGKGVFFNTVHFSNI